jgi:predicted GTPase
MMVGSTGVGKSATINALFGAGQPIGAVEATTITPTGLEVSTGRSADATLMSGTRGLLWVFDMPGLGDDVRTDPARLELYRSILPQIDVMLWIDDASSRTVSMTQNYVAEVFKDQPELASRLVVGLNKADLIYPGDWIDSYNIPSQAQLANLDDREQAVTERIAAVLPGWPRSVVAYSAYRRYRLPSLFVNMMKAVRRERRWVLESRADIADFRELVDQRLLVATELVLGSGK